MRKPWYYWLYVRSPIAKIVLGIVAVMISIVVLLAQGWMEERRMQAQTNNWEGRSIEKGAEIFANNCSTCHAADGKGLAGVAPALYSRYFFTQRMADVGWTGTLHDYVALTVAAGRPSKTKSQWAQIMPTWGVRFGGPLRDDQVEYVTQFVLNWESDALQQSWDPRAAEAVRVATAVPITPTGMLTATITVTATEDVTPTAGLTVTPPITQPNATTATAAATEIVAVTQTSNATSTSDITSTESATATTGMVGADAMGQPVASAPPSAPAAVLDPWQPFQDAPSLAAPDTITYTVGTLGAAAVGAELAATAVVTDATGAETAPAIIPPEQLFVSMACSGCHMLGTVGVGVIGPDLNPLPETAGTKVAGQDAETYVYTSIVEPNAFINEGYPAGVMPANFKDRMSEEEIRGLVAWLLDPNRGY